MWVKPTLNMVKLILDWGINSGFFWSEMLRLIRGCRVICCITVHLLSSISLVPDLPSYHFEVGIANILIEEHFNFSRKDVTPKVNKNTERIRRLKAPVLDGYPKIFTYIFKDLSKHTHTHTQISIEHHGFIQLLLNIIECNLLFCP